MALAKARRQALLLLAAVLLAVGLPVSPHVVVAVDESHGETVRYSVVVSAVPPGRVVGRPVADPVVVKVHSPAELIALSAAEPQFTQLGDLADDLKPTTRSAQLPAAGNRAPPA